MKKSKKKYIIFLLIIVIIVMPNIILGFIKGPTITVNNCNENSIISDDSELTCKICNTGQNYYYVNGSRGIFRIGENNKSELFFDNTGVRYIACNSESVYAMTNNEIIQLSPQGVIMVKKSIEEKGSGIYATENAVLYVSGSIYHILDSKSLNEMTIKDFLNNPQKTEISEYKIFSGDKYSIISRAPVFDGSKSSFTGTIFSNDNKIINIAFDKIIGRTEEYFLRYAGYNTQLVIKDISEGLEFIHSNRTDIRHVTTANDLLISFSSIYSDKKFLKTFFMPQNKYRGGSDCIEEEPLLFHSFDEVTMINCKNNETISHKTLSGEKVIYLNYDKMITYYKGEYITYSVDNWKKINSYPADEIKNNGSYTFETCGNYIFVFDDNSGELLNTIDIT